mgnify:CR=1 FL=1
MGVDTSDSKAQDDVVVNELHLPLGRKILFKMRSQDVLHSAYMPHFRAQMNCVPGMITQFAFTPSVTTEQMRMDEEVMGKVSRINTIRRKNSLELKNPSYYNSNHSTPFETFDNYQPNEIFEYSESDNKPINNNNKRIVLR